MSALEMCPRCRATHPVVQAGECGGCGWSRTDAIIPNENARREIYSVDNGRERIIAFDDHGGRGTWLLRAHLDGDQSILIPFAAMPAVRAELANTRAPAQHRAPGEVDGLVERLREALDPLVRQGGYYRPEIPHFVSVEVPLEYLRRARNIYLEVFGCEPRSAEDEAAERAGGALEALGTGATKGGQGK